MNPLAGRIGELLAGEREEVADLAHRLRTPVTALRLNVDSVTDADDRARLEADVDALARAVDEVIRTARRPVSESAGRAADLARVAAERVAFWSALAEDTGRPVETYVPGVPVPVRASVRMSRRRWTRCWRTCSPTRRTGGAPGGGAAVAEAAAASSWRTPGPACPPGRSRAWCRGGGSTGLGLDIARRTAESSGGSMALGVSSMGGARVELRFGSPE